MEIIEVKCTNCNKNIYIQKEHVREKIFCTLGCMDLYAGAASVNGRTFK